MKITQAEAKKELAKRELARRHLLDFVLYNYDTYKVNWHHELLAKKLEAVERGEIKRLMVFMPPRHGKSEMCSIQFPAWVIGKNRDRHIIQASYSADLAHDFGRQTRNLVNSQEFKNVFRDVQLSDDSQSKGKWNTNGRGAYNAVGVGGAVTGKGADFLLIDDPIKNRQDANSSVYREAVWDWYRSTARTRLTPNGAIILIMTRWHEDDLAGRILRNDPEGWEVIELPAIAIQDDEHRKIGEALWPDHYSLETLEQTKKDLGSFEWSSLYQQRPIDEESQEFKKEWFQEVEWEQVAVLDTAKYMTVDTAISQTEGADNTGIVMNYVSRENKWFLKSWKLRVNAMELINFLFKVYMDERPDKIGIEETVYLQAIKPFIEEEQRRRNIFLPIEPLKHAQRAKIARVRGLIPRYQSKSIFHIKGLCSELEDELLSFPKGVHDDVCDACAYQNDIAKPPVSQMVHRVYENRLKNKSFK